MARGFERDECGCAYTNPVDKALGDQSLAWTKATVTSENKAFLRTLVSEIRFAADSRRVLLVHGSPRRINEYLFEDRPVSSFQRLASSSQADIIVFGHTQAVHEARRRRALRECGIGRQAEGRRTGARATSSLTEPTPRIL